MFATMLRQRYMFMGSILVFSDYMADRGDGSPVSLKKDTNINSTAIILYYAYISSRSKTRYKVTAMYYTT